MSILNMLFGSKPKSDKVRILSKEEYTQAIKKGKVQSKREAVRRTVKKRRFNQKGKL